MNNLMYSKFYYTGKEVLLFETIELIRNQFDMKTENLT